MIELYLASAAFGLVLVGASAFLGGHDQDADHDAGSGMDLGKDLDVGKDLDLGKDLDGFGSGGADAGLDAHVADASHAIAASGGHGGGLVKDVAAPGPWLPFTSLRFWSFFAAAFGVTGSALALFGVGEPFVGLVAAPTGLGVGWGAAWLLRQLRTDTVTGDVRLDRYSGEEGRVVVPVRPGSTGKIRLSLRTGVLDLPARSADGQVLDAGAPVLVTAVRDGVAEVTGLARVKRRAPEMEPPAGT